jgi:hypothetical protein
MQMTQAFRTNVAPELRATTKARRKERRIRSRVIGLGIIAALALVAIGSVSHAEARVAADNSRMDGVAWYCGDLQDRYDYYSGLYQQRQAANPNDPSLSSLKSEMQQYVYKWEANCRSSFGSITFFNPALQDIVNVGNLSVIETTQTGGAGGGRPSHAVTKGSGLLVAR